MDTPQTPDFLVPDISDLTQDVCETKQDASKRPGSNLSVASAVPSKTSSGRSTPMDSVLDKNMPHPGWSSSPKLIGNIICIIPPTDIPLDVAEEHKIASDSSLEKTESKDPQDVSSGSSTPIYRSNSVSLRKNGDVSADSCDKHQGGELPSTTERRSYPLTSKLTQLTDFSDPLLGYQNTKDESIFHTTNTHSISLKEIKQTQYKRFRKALDGVNLSVSPYHKYSVPFIETDKGALCAVRKYLPDEIFWSSLFDGESTQRSVKSKSFLDVESTKAVNKTNIEILDSHAFITSSLTQPIWENSMQVSGEHI